MWRLGIFLLIIGCAFTPKYDVNRSCTEESFLAYNLLTSTDYEYRLVIGIRYDVIGDIVSPCYHAWVEYGKDDEWSVYDPYIVYYEGMVSEYVPLFYNVDEYFITEDTYHELGYDACICIIRENDKHVLYLYYKQKHETKWFRHSFKGQTWLEE